jgi:hypothetical protein
MLSAALNNADYEDDDYDPAIMAWLDEESEDGD